MATTTHYVSGIAHWAKVHKPDERYQKYSIDLHLDDDAFKEFSKIGLRNQAKNVDGKWKITLRRDPNSKVYDNKIQKLAGAPLVTDANGAPCHEHIGNGSEVTCKFTVYDYDNSYGKGKGSRLEHVRVDNLVKYERQEQPGLAPVDAAAPASVPVKPKVLF